MVDASSISVGNCWQLRVPVKHIPRWFDSSTESGCEVSIRIRLPPEREGWGNG